MDNPAGHLRPSTSRLILRHPCGDYFESPFAPDVFRGTADQDVERAWLHHKSVVPHVVEGQLFPWQDKRRRFDFLPVSD